MDDGKSTLIGRLLLDTDCLAEDQLEMARSNLAVTDGLRQERLQGITIDVAYRYFSTSDCRVILADSPGHFEYTRNMITATSTADALLLLVDVTKGLTEQTKRHFYLASLLKVPYLLVCVNKMDLVGFSEGHFYSICKTINFMQRDLSFGKIDFIPISALSGENIARKSSRMPWCKGSSLLGRLAEIPRMQIYQSNQTRAYVQRRVSIQGLDYYQIWLCTGKLKVGNQIKAYPGDEVLTVNSLKNWKFPVTHVSAPAAVLVTFEEHRALERGTLLCKLDDANLPKNTNQLEATVCWMDNAPLRRDSRYKLMHTTNLTDITDLQVCSKVDIDRHIAVACASGVETNDICNMQITLARKIAVDTWQSNRLTGSFVLIDDQTNFTAAAGFITAVK
ncbi:MAG: 50S ribosome-binding GTPase [Oligoflexia bacterium]|nr:50S ribosome-binding GTPase [Oligoflexia bacterium]